MLSNLRRATPAAIDASSAADTILDSAQSLLDEIDINEGINEGETRGRRK